jgi:hypothetical protein
MAAARQNTHSRRHDDDNGGVCALATTTIRKVKSVRLFCSLSKLHSLTLLSNCRMDNYLSIIVSVSSSSSSIIGNIDDTFARLFPQVAASSLLSSEQEQPGIVRLLCCPRTAIIIENIVVVALMNRPTMEKWHALGFFFSARPKTRPPSRVRMNESLSFSR